MVAHGGHLQAAPPEQEVLHVRVTGNFDRYAADYYPYRDVQHLLFRGRGLQVADMRDHGLWAVVLDGHAVVLAAGIGRAALLDPREQHPLLAAYVDYVASVVVGDDGVATARSTA